MRLFAQAGLFLWFSIFLFLSYSPAGFFHDYFRLSSMWPFWWNFLFQLKMFETTMTTKRWGTIILKSNSCKGFEVIVKVVKMCKIIENVLTRSCYALQRIEIPNWTTHFGGGFYYHDESGADCQETIVNIDSCYKESTCNFPSWQIPGDQRRYLVGFLRFDLYICLPSCRKGAVHGTVYLDNLCCLAGEPHVILYSKYLSTTSLPSFSPLFLFTFSTSSKKHCTRIIKSC